jgi:hypothetical protein
LAILMPGLTFWAYSTFTVLHLWGFLLFIQTAAGLTYQSNSISHWLICNLNLPRSWQCWLVSLLTTEFLFR